MSKRNLDNNGITLIELIIVIAIMSVLLGIISPQYLKYVERSRRVVDITTAKQIKDSFDRVLATDNPSLEINGEKFLSVAWDKTKKMPTIGNENHFLDYIFEDLGQVPQSKSIKEFMWIVRYDFDYGYVTQIQLMDKKTGKAYELYPESNTFLNHK